ncbi:MAG: 7-carboxy-7-deazaguanine synthase QueE [Cytophagaceae bacterium]|nr:7-carboxy-7-deazaguanine synthase QueE [Cytophagaceae bacterium]MBK9936402.1 7-carboxy-7-deazaguanine synthase QueE [Cytophagaceae bacterium]MBL0300151.1 7-carboxy-7-deazaguanine synthase QueE [Cytophagaceae bacterium]MBL0327088.1 7-carboxy-7-deazaguanine synthase QueE [Cytophagaceae bacterium]
MEAFYTLQGEGHYSGHAAYFIRLGGCDVGCVWCDVKESWDAEVHPKYSVEKIVNQASEFPKSIAVITGGEPLMYNLDELTQALKSAGFRTNIETSGAHPFTGNWDWVCFSPKKFKEPLPEIYTKANELKIIIFNKSDFEFAEKYATLVNPECNLFLQPEWDKREKITPLIIDYIKANPKWSMSLQTHKYLDIP